VRIALADALVRTVERVRTLRARVVVVGPAPGIGYDVPTALVRTLQGIGQLPPTRRSDFDLQHREVMAALAAVAALDGVAVVYPHTVLCDQETCAVADGLRALYTDSSHPSPFAAARVSALVAQAVERSGWTLAN